MASEIFEPRKSLADPCRPWDATAFDNRLGEGRHGVPLAPAPHENPGTLSARSTVISWQDHCSTIRRPPWPKNRWNSLINSRSRRPDPLRPARP